MAAELRSSDSRGRLTPHKSNALKIIEASSADAKEASGFSTSSFFVLRSSLVALRSSPYLTTLTKMMRKVNRTSDSMKASPTNKAI
jgi:hypothetical protein